MIGAATIGADRAHPAGDALLSRRLLGSLKS